MDYIASRFKELVIELTAVCCGTAPTIETFLTIVIGWILCTGRRTTSGIIRAAGHHAMKSHDVYHNFFSQSKWSIDTLWQTYFFCVVSSLSLSKTTIQLAGDDTLVKHYGKKIWGAGLYRDAVRSSRKHIAYAWGLNWVVLVLIIEVPFAHGHLIALPIYARLNPKSATPVKKKGKGSKRKKTSVAIMVDMVTTVARWLPTSLFIFCGDGAYAGIAHLLPSNVKMVSRIRRDAALYAPPKRHRKKGTGRPPKKGKRLLSPEKKARRTAGWKLYDVVLYGKRVRRLVQQYQALWYEVCPNQCVIIVAVKDPDAKKDTEFFFTTDLSMTAEKIIYTYTGRWPIEVVFRESKQYLGLQDSQARTKEAVLRTTPFCLWLNSFIKFWFIIDHSNALQYTPSVDEWYPYKSTISFQDMLGSLRHQYWSHSILSMSTNNVEVDKICKHLLTVLSKVS